MAILFFVYTIILLFVITQRCERILPFDTKATLPLRGILAVGIILHHLARTLSFGTSNAVMHQFAGVGGAIVTLFFFMTGYGLSVSFQRKGRAYLEGFFSKRLTKLIIPLIPVIIIYYAECYFFTGIREDIWMDIKAGSVFSPNSWYVYELILFYCLFYICCKKFSLRSSSIIILIVSLLMMAIMQKYGFGRPWYRSTISLSVGMFYAISEKKIQQIFFRHRLTLTSMALAYCATAFIWCIFRIDENTLLNAIDNIILPVITVFILYTIRFPENKLLNFLGNISYELYIVHGLIIAFATKWVYNDLTFCLFTLPTSILAAWLLQKQCNPMKSIFSTTHKKERDFSTSEADLFLQDICHAPTGSAICDNTLKKEPQYDLQIVVPAYNAEKYIKACIDSIITQETKYKFLIVVVNDGSKDKTGEILNGYNDDRICVITQENRGFSGARNRALENIDARYIMFVDSDDMLYPGTIEALMNKAYADDADIVEGGYRLFIGPLTIKRVKRNEGKSDLYGFPWGKVYKSELWEKVHFPEGFWFEDTVNIFIVFQLAKKIANVNHLVYHYRKNLKGISVTSKGKPKVLDCLWITRQLLKDRETIGLTNDVNFLNTILWQMQSNYRRVETLHNKDISRALFVIQKSMLETYFPSYRTDINKSCFPDVINSFYSNDYNMFRNICLK